MCGFCVVISVFVFWRVFFSRRSHLFLSNSTSIHLLFFFSLPVYVLFFIKCIIIVIVIILNNYNSFMYGLDYTVALVDTFKPNKYKLNVNIPDMFHLI